MKVGVYFSKTDRKLIKSLDENKRMLIITPYGKKYEELCEAVL